MAKHQELPSLGNLSVTCAVGTVDTVGSSGFARRDAEPRCSLVYRHLGHPLERPLLADYEAEPHLLHTHQDRRTKLNAWVSSRLSSLSASRFPPWVELLPVVRKNTGLNGCGVLLLSRSAVTPVTRNAEGLL